ncbi:MAG TPA: DUF6249 domain-containing protein [Chthoniobacterales bacterium]|nr:DUF6249 domain-containing protein [Chthoniobacterales bacterium]
MKTTFLTCLCSIALALSVLGQTPTAPPTSPAAQPSVSASVTPAVSPSATAADEDSIERAVSRKLRHRFGVTLDKHRSVTSINRHDDDEDMAGAGMLMAIPIVGIVFTTLFGGPVLIVAAIMFFSYLKSRSLHRTVREMVEKGQEVPAALFVTPPAIKTRSDLRRGVVLMMVGVGVMIFFGAVNEWEGGAWSLGIIPFLIGAGYLLVWKLEAHRDKVPPLP